MGDQQCTEADDYTQENVKVIHIFFKRGKKSH